MNQYKLVDIGGNDAKRKFEVKGTFYHRTVLNRIFEAESAKNHQEFYVDVTLVPEPDNPHSQSGEAISVRWNDQVIGYISSEDAPQLQQLRRVAASGADPVTEARIWTHVDDQLERRFWVSMLLSRPDLLLPLNPAPEGAYSVLPKGAAVQVTKEDDHLDVLRQYLQATGRAHLLVTLHLIDIGVRSAQPRIEVQIDGARVGELSKGSSSKFIPVVMQWEELGYKTVAHARIDGSPLSVEMLLFAAPAYEITEAQMKLKSIYTLPALVDFESDVSNYLVPSRFQNRADDAGPETQKTKRSKSILGGQIASTPTIPIGPGLPTQDEWIRMLAPDGSARATPLQRGYVRGAIGKRFVNNRAPRMDYMTVGQAEQLLQFFDEPVEQLYRGGRNSRVLWWILVVLLVAIIGIFSIFGDLGAVFLLITLIVVGHHFWTRRKLEFPFAPRK